MRLRENAVYVRLSTYADLLDGGGHLDAIRDLETLTGARFARYRDLAATRAREQTLIDRRDALLGVHVGAGFHQTARFRLDADGPELLSLELNAGLHPYSGVYTTQIDARVGAAFASSAAAELRALAERWVERFDPLTLQVHDVDDDAVQNIDSPRLAELGYGRSAPAAAEERPGREAIRGQFRLVPTWVSYVGADALALLRPEDLDTVDAEMVRTESGGALFVLAERPDACEDPGFREAQRALRAALRIDELVARDRRTFAYWKRKH